MNYNLNILKLIKDTLPPFFRNGKIVDWLSALLKPVNDLEDEFVTFRSDTDEILKWTGQTISIQNLLIERFGPGITVVNVNNPITPFYMWGATDRRNNISYGPGDKRNPRINSPGAYDLESVDFEVNVPSSILFSEDQMTAIIKQHSLYSKRFKIVIIP